MASHNSNSPTGESADLLINSNDCLIDIFRCFICMERLSDARLCPHCSKLCCYMCIARWLTQQRSQCPHCRAPLSVEELVNCRWFGDVAAKVESLQKTCESLKTSNESDKENNYCKKHENEKLSVYCWTCQCCICQQCALFGDQHSGHTFKQIEQIYESHHSQIRSELVKLRTYTLELTGLIQYVDLTTKLVRNIKDQKEKEARKVSQLASNNLDAQLKLKLGALMRQKSTILHEFEQLNHIIEVIEIQMRKYSKPQLIIKSPELLRTIQKVPLKPISEYQKPPIDTDFNSDIVPNYKTGEFLIKPFSQFKTRTSPLYSTPIKRNGITWRLKVYPNGNGTVRGEFLSVFLELTEGPPVPRSYDYRVQLVHQNSYKIVEREFMSSFQVGECWGYNRFCSLQLISEEGYLNTQDDSILMRFQIRHSSYRQKSDDKQWYINKLLAKVEGLENEIRLLKAKARNSNNRDDSLPFGTNDNNINMNSRRNNDDNNKKSNTKENNDNLITDNRNPTGNQNGEIDAPTDVEGAGALSTLSSTSVSNSNNLKKAVKNTTDNLNRFTTLDSASRSINSNNSNNSNRKTAFQQNHKTAINNGCSSSSNMDNPSRGLSPSIMEELEFDLDSQRPRENTGNIPPNDNDENDLRWCNDINCDSFAHGNMNGNGNSGTNVGNQTSSGVNRNRNRNLNYNYFLDNFFPENGSRDRDPPIIFKELPDQREDGGMSSSSGGDDDYKEYRRLRNKPKLKIGEFEIVFDIESTSSSGRSNYKDDNHRHLKQDSNLKNAAGRQSVLGTLKEPPKLSSKLYPASEFCYRSTDDEASSSDGNVARALPIRHHSVGHDLLKSKKTKPDFNVDDDSNSLNDAFIENRRNSEDPCSRFDRLLQNIRLSPESKRHTTSNIPHLSLPRVPHNMTTNNQFNRSIQHRDGLFTTIDFISPSTGAIKKTTNGSRKTTVPDEMDSSMNTTTTTREIDIPSLCNTESSELNFNSFYQDRAKKIDYFNSVISDNSDTADDSDTALTALPSLFTTTATTQQAPTEPSATSNHHTSVSNNSELWSNLLHSNSPSYESIPKQNKTNNHTTNTTGTTSSLHGHNNANVKSVNNAGYLGRQPPFNLSHINFNSSPLRPPPFLTYQPSCSIYDPFCLVPLQRPLLPYNSNPFSYSTYPQFSLPNIGNISPYNSFDPKRLPSGIREQQQQSSSLFTPPNHTSSGNETSNAIATNPLMEESTTERTTYSQYPTSSGNSTIISKIQKKAGRKHLRKTNNHNNRSNSSSGDTYYDTSDN